MRVVLVLLLLACLAWATLIGAGAGAALDSYILAAWFGAGWTLIPLDMRLKEYSFGAILGGYIVLLLTFSGLGVVGRLVGEDAGYLVAAGGWNAFAAILILVPVRRGFGWYQA